MSMYDDYREEYRDSCADEDGELTCGECSECARSIQRKYDAIHCATEAAWWRDVGSVLLGFPDEGTEDSGR